MTRAQGTSPEGRGRPTMVDVARAAGVSTALVSIVMRGVPGASDETRQRVMEVAEELGYVPDQRARKLRQARSGLLGVVFELQQPFHGDLVEQLYRAAARHGYDISLSAVSPSRTEQTAVEALRHERCEALLLLGSGLDTGQLTRLAQALPIVCLARRANSPAAGAVHGDDRAGIGLAVDHLVALGHRRIAHIDGAEAPGSDDRRRGFVERTDHHGLRGSAELRTGGLTESDGARGMLELLAHDVPPTAVIAFNDRCATGVLDMLVRAGLDVPGDVSVVGYDDSRLAKVPHVQMTTVSQDAEGLAEAAVSEARSLIAASAPGETVLTPRLVVRTTTGPAPRD